jgi:hypothetical protein
MGLRIASDIRFVPIKEDSLMPTVRNLAISLIALLMLAPSSAFADGRHVVSPAAVAATVSQHVAQQDSERAAVREALAKPEVRDMAARMGLDADRAAAAVGTLAGADLERAASAATQVNHQLVGGASTVIISTTTILIALLVVILIIVAVK